MHAIETSALCASVALALAASGCAPEPPPESFERRAGDLSSSSDAGSGEAEPGPLDAAAADAGGPVGGGSGLDAGGDSGAACLPRPSTDPLDGDVNLDLSVELQAIQGFGGINVPGWIPDLTAEQVDTAFGNGPEQIGMSILRVRIPFDAAEFPLELPAAQRAVSLGAKVIASPWTPPPELKSNGDIVGGSLNVESHAAYADHLLSFRDFMADNGVPLYAISVQNEPDIQVSYESCDWTPQQLAGWIAEQGPRFGETRLMAAESFNFNPLITDPILQNPASAAEVDIIAGHIYGRPPADYPLARSLGKELWMTEHYTSSNISANAWPEALAVGKEIHDCMSASFSAYVWWYIRRSYGPLTEDGLISKRGYLMAQYSRFIRPGFVRVAATPPAAPDVFVTAYKGDGRVVVVAVNVSSDPRDITLDADGSCVDRFERYTTSESENVAEQAEVVLSAGRAALTLPGQSVTTFVSP